MTPTIDDYLKAKAVTNAYENEQQRLFENRLMSFRKELTEYFEKNKVAGYTIKEFELREHFGSYDIIPTSPPLEEDYDGENNEDIKKIANKHNIKASFVYWMYHK